MIAKQSVMLVQSSLPIPPFLGLAKNWRYSETAVLGGITFKNLRLEMGGIGKDLPATEG